MNPSTPSRSVARTATLGGILTALSFLALLGAAMLPTGRLGAYFLASVFVAGVTCEDQPLTAFLAFLATSALGFFLLPDKFALLPYVGLLGWYGVAKYLIERRFSGALQLGLKFIVGNLAAVVTAVAVVKIFGLPLTLSDGLHLFGLSLKVPVWILFIVLEIAFGFYDFLYTMVANYYVRHIRPRVFSARR